MPFSQTSQLSPILSWVEEASPRSILDIGIGMGQYGFMLRTKLEGLNLFRVEGDKGWMTPKAEWSIRIDGIEGCAPYITPVQEWSYNRIIIDDAIQALRTIPDNEYELLLAIDILEHFDKADGEFFLQELKRIAARAALISTPKEFIEQEVAANPLENHRSFWTEAELTSAGFLTTLPNDESWISVWQN